jgi:hypothetical protein
VTSETFSHPPETMSNSRPRNRRFDSSVILVLLTRLVPLLAAPVTLWMIATRRSLAEQGLYFVFWNVQALTQLMELSIGGLIVQFASHESSALHWSEHGALEGDLAATARLHALIQAGRRWYIMVGIALLLLGAGGGTWLMHARTSGQAEPLLPWLVTILATAAYLPLAPSLCAIEGCHGLIRVQRMRLVQVMAAIASLWIVLFRYGALWAVATYSVVWLGVAFVWLARAHTDLLTSSRASDAPSDRDHGIGTVQWRTGASWLAWWIAPQAVTPIVLATQGALAAGRVGMTLAIATAPLTLAGAFMSARYPRYGALVAKGAIVQLRQLAWSATRQATTVLIVGTAAAALVVSFLDIAAPVVAARIMLPSDVLLIGIGNLAWLLIQSLGSYLRAWREEPLMEMAIIGVIVVVLGTFVASHTTSARGTLATYAALVAFVALPLAIVGARRIRAGCQA